METRLVYRMEDTHHHGPFNPALSQHDMRGVLNMWEHVPWAEVKVFGLSPRDGDTTHPHHVIDVLHGDYQAASRAEYLHQMPIAGNWLVGCKDLRQFYHWFPPCALPYFAEVGLLLHIYECPNASVLLGQWQLMFDPKQAKLVKSERLDCPELLAA